MYPNRLIYLLVVIAILVTAYSPQRAIETAPATSLPPNSSPSSVPTEHKAWIVVMG